VCGVSGQRHTTQLILPAVFRQAWIPVSQLAISDWCIFQHSLEDAVPQVYKILHQLLLVQYMLPIGVTIGLMLWLRE
jgi:hypothetical protein